jgi:hypothetical protein
MRFMVAKSAFALGCCMPRRDIKVDYQDLLCLGLRFVQLHHGFSYQGRSSAFVTKVDSV